MPDNHPQHPDIIFLHGWGQSAQIWFQQHKYFSRLYRTHFINLPGHGGEKDMVQQQWLTHLQQQITGYTEQRPVILVGWSLSGQLALQLQATLEHQVVGLILVGTTPCFRQQPGWMHGCDKNAWHEFTMAAEQQNPRLMQRFFQMMLHGSQLSRPDMQRLAKEAVNKQTPASTLALNTGLSFLSKLDLRLDVQSIALPTLVIHGEQDAIVPFQAGRFLAENIPHATLHVFHDCGHAPFLTHHAAFNQLLDQWLEQWWKNLSM